jgi:nitroreductase
MIAYDSDISWKSPFNEGVDSGYVDASIAITHMILQATDLGLGTLWVGYFDIAKLSEHFKLPGNIVPVALLPVGYPSDDVKPNPLHDQSLDIEQLII